MNSTSETLFDLFLTLKLAFKIWGRIRPRGVIWANKNTVLFQISIIKRNNVLIYIKMKLLDRAFYIDVKNAYTFFRFDNSSWSYALLKRSGNEKNPVCPIKHNFNFNYIF